VTIRDVGVGRYGTFEVGIDCSRVEWPGELWVVNGPDPRILVADEMLHQIVQHPERIHPGVRLEWQPLEPCPPESCCKLTGLLALRGNNCFYGALLSFDTQQGRIIYRIGTINAELNAWWAQWPD
jgi:hypothetical protein